MAPIIQHSHCYIDITINNHRKKLEATAAFVSATDTRYGFSCKDLRYLGGSERTRIVRDDLMRMDHDWSDKANELYIADNEPVVIHHDPAVDGGRIVVELFWDVAPLACENFMMLCAAGSVLDSATAAGGKNSSNKTTQYHPISTGVCGKPLTYRGSKFHRVVPGFVMQGGDFVLGNGSGGESIFNKKFKDERPGLLLRKHDCRGVLSMGNSGKNSNSSQFFFTFGPAPQCDGKHVIFGRVVSGYQVMDAVENCGSKSGQPTKNITITDCGIYEPLLSPGAGFWFDQPDVDSFTGSTPVFMSRPRLALVAPQENVASKFRAALGSAVVIEHTIINDSNNNNEDEHKVQIQEEIKHLLDGFVIDAVVFAPFCQDYVPSSERRIPPRWKTAVERYNQTHNISISSSSSVMSEGIYIVAKPSDAKSQVSSKMWLNHVPVDSRRWQIDQG